MARALWRATVIVHRYLGVAVGFLMLMWFVSGIVMMYVGFPELDAKERARMLAPIPWEACCSFSVQRLEDDQPIRSLELETVIGQPMMFVRPENQPGRIASLAATGPSFEVDEAVARQAAIDAAERIIEGPAESATVDLIDRDQWTLGGEYGPHRPLYRYAFDDAAGTTFYVSSATGQVLLWTTASERFWNWLGAVPHWLYPTVLRANGPLWSQIVIWSSIVGGFLTVIGIVLGITQFRRWPSGRMSPYRGWFYWHHYAGLIFGVITVTFVISGTFSMNPWGFLEGGGGRGEIGRLAGEAVPWSEIRASLESIKSAPPGDDVVEISTAPLAGKLFWLATRSDGSTERLNAAGTPAPVAPPDLRDAARRIAGTESIASEEMIADEDAYYFSHHEEVVLPAYRFVLNDAEHTRYYLDPKSAQIVSRVDATGRERRWLFDGLHRIDFAQWLRWRPLWDIVVIFLMLGGIAISGTGTWLAVMRVKRDLTFTRVPRTRDVPEQAE